MRPRFTGSRPTSALRRVVFPAPLGPRSTVTPPSRSRSTSWRTSARPRTTETFDSFTRTSPIIVIGRAALEGAAVTAIPSGLDVVVLHRPVPWPRAGVRRDAAVVAEVDAHLHQRRVGVQRLGRLLVARRLATSHVGQPVVPDLMPLGPLREPDDAAYANGV